MKQILQEFKTGKTYLVETSVPVPGPEEVLIRSSYSLVSSGTERMLVEFGKKSLLGKAISQPDRVYQVLEKIRKDGLVSAYKTVLNKLDTPIPLGYCNSGIVEAVGSRVTRFRPGDRVASNGPHAEYVLVAENLVAKVPDGVSLEDACFTVAGAISLQGIRLMAPSLGERVVVTGLGLLGMMAVQLLLMNGCEVLALDLDPGKVAKAADYGARAFLVTAGKDPVDEILHATEGVGADAVLITASGSGDEIISQAARMCRKRARIVLVGVVGLDLKRADFYEKELSFQVSCSYGPGRYEPAYESKNLDYPIAYVRWTENRNFQAILRGIESGKLEVKSLVSGVAGLEEFDSVYESLGNAQGLARLFRYSVEDSVRNGNLAGQVRSHSASRNSIGIMGAGDYVSSVILPEFEALKTTPVAICSSQSARVGHLAKKYAIPKIYGEPEELLSDQDVHGLVIATRHHTHADLVLRALKQNKHVMVEKPLALDLGSLNDITRAQSDSWGSLTVGYNRRFSPCSVALRAALSESPAPVQIVATMNAGSLPESHWTQDPLVGGGRILGEACHYFDLAIFLTGSLIKKVYMSSMGPYKLFTDHASIILDFENGSSATLHYFSNGSRAYPKERIEVHQLGKTAVIDNFRKLDSFGFSGLGGGFRQDKGHKAQFKTWLEFLKQGGQPPIPYPQLENGARAALMALESFRLQMPVLIGQNS